MLSPLLLNRSLLSKSFNKKTFYYIKSTFQWNETESWRVLALIYQILFGFWPTCLAEEVTASMFSEGNVIVFDSQQLPLLLFSSRIQRCRCSYAGAKRRVRNHFRQFVFACIANLCKRVVKELQHSLSRTLQGDKPIVKGSLCSICDFISFISKSWLRWLLIWASFWHSLLLNATCVSLPFRYYIKAWRVRYIYW